MNSNTTKLLKILIIDDDQIDTLFIRKLLSQSHLPVSHIENAESLSQAFAILDNNKFDAVLLDLNLPDSAGIDTLVEISKRYPQIASVVITGQHPDDLDDKNAAAGTQEYLVKGDYNAETLTKSIQYAIERKRIGQILDRKQKNLEAIFDAVPIGMMLIDENKTIRRVNDAIRQIVHRDYRQIINNPIGVALGCLNCRNPENICGQTSNCNHCLLREAVDTALHKKQSARRIEIQPTLIVDEKEISPWFLISAEPAMIDGQNYAVIAFDDISSRKKTEQKLKETMTLKSQFISTVSHELRTPLACIKEGVTIVQEGVAGTINAKQKNFLDIAKRNIDRLADLVNDVLDFQKLDSGKGEFDIRQNDIKQIALEIHNTMLHFAKKKDVDLTLELDPKIPKVSFDSNKIIQVMTNLISNAIKFTPSPGQVTVSIKQHNAELSIAISDTGLGIPQEDLSKIFDHFHRVNRPGKQIQGTGLGLAIVKKIISSHNGRIEVQSKINEGTTFTIFLPLEPKLTDQIITVQKDQQLENILTN